jgi:hypothetical protein
VLLCTTASLGPAEQVDAAARQRLDRVGLTGGGALACLLHEAGRVDGAAPQAGAEGLEHRALGTAGRAAGHRGRPLREQPGLGQLQLQRHVAARRDPGDGGLVERDAQRRERGRERCRDLGVSGRGQGGQGGEGAEQQAAHTAILAEPAQGRHQQAVNDPALQMRHGLRQGRLALGAQPVGRALPLQTAQQIRLGGVQAAPLRGEADAPAQQRMLERLGRRQLGLDTGVARLLQGVPGRRHLPVQRADAHMRLQAQRRSGP